jgi:hypothetical protein
MPLQSLLAAGGGLIWVDIALPELNLVVETDGPWHFTHNTEEYTGGTLCRNWLIERLGYRLICVGIPFWQVSGGRQAAERSGRAGGRRGAPVCGVGLDCSI